MFAIAALLASTPPAHAGPDDERPADGPPLAPAEGANFVAVVVGLSSYEALPDPVELDFARSDAAVVHKQLKAKANFTHTFLVTDGEATRDNIRDLLRTEVAQLLGPDDVFLFYFVGHGIGADLDAPALLTFDAKLEDAQGTGLDLTELAGDLGTWAQAGQTLIVTDVIHRNQLDGVYFFGPAANQWPAMNNTVVVSASQADSPGRDGAFGTVFADAISGAADANRDGFVTVGEMEDYLDARLAPSGQIPVRAPTESPREAVISRGVKNAGSTTDPSTTSAPIPAAASQFPDTDVWSAKFVFREGGSQSVQCPQEEVKACAPSCYVRNFKAGICKLKAVVDGVELTGRVPVVYPGKYSCGLRAGALTCRPPLEPAEKTEE